MNRSRVEQDSLELRLVEILVGRRGYCVVEARCDDRYLQFTIRKQRK